MLAGEAWRAAPATGRAGTKTCMAMVPASVTSTSSQMGARTRSANTGASAAVARPAPMPASLFCSLMLHSCAAARMRGCRANANPSTVPNTMTRQANAATAALMPQWSAIQPTAIMGSMEPSSPIT